jgi:hypothetical protein
LGCVQLLAGGRLPSRLTSVPPALILLRCLAFGDVNRRRCAGEADPDTDELSKISKQLLQLGVLCFAAFLLAASAGAEP